MKASRDLSNKNLSVFITKVEQFRQFECIDGWRALVEAVKKKSEISG
jgi:hypothetical protein